MSLSSTKPLMKQSSIFDSENKQRTGLSSSMKKVSFNSTVLTDSDEENSIGRHNRRSVKNKDDDDDLLSMFKNELDDSDDDDDDIMIGTSSSKKDKPSPKPRHKPNTKAHVASDSLLQTNDLEQTINPKRKPRPPPRAGTAGDSLSEDSNTVDTHEITKPKVPARRERLLSAKERKTDIETNEVKSQISLDDSDDDLVISTSQMTTERKQNKGGLESDLLGENDSNKSKKSEKKDSSFIESLFGSSSKPKKEESLVKDILQENADENGKDEPKLEKHSTKSSTVDNTFGSPAKQKTKQNSIEDGEEGIIDEKNRTKHQEDKPKHKSMLSKETSKSSDEEEVSTRQKSKPVIKERGMLTAEDGKKTKTNKDEATEDRIKQKEKSSKSMLGASDEDIILTQTKRNQKTKNVTNSDDDDIGSNKRKQKGRSQKSLLDDSDDDDNDDTKAGKIRQKARGQKSLLDDSDDDDMVERRRDPNTRKQTRENEDQDINKSKSRTPAPPPRKHLQDPAFKSRKKIKDGSLDSEEDETNTRNVPIPKTRKNHKDEAELLRSKPQTKLHYLDKDEYDSDEDELQHFQKSRQNMIGKGDRSDKMKSGKTAVWSSLDDSDDDDDETVGKKISLTKARPVSAKRNEKQGNGQEAPPTPSPRSPRPKPRHIPASVHQKLDRNRERSEEDSQLDKRDYNGNREKSRSKNEREFSPLGRPTPQRPRSSQWKQNDLRREEEDITHMFEEHVPDRSDVIGRRTEPDRMHARDHRRPYSAVTPKRGPMRAEHRIEEMTKSPQLQKTLTRYEERDDDDDDWKFTPQHSMRKQRSSSLTNLHQTGQSGYTGYDDEEGGRRGSLDTDTIRQTVYDNWLNRKNVTIKKELSKKALQKKKEEELAKEKEEKRRSAELAFRSWSKSKEGTIKEKQAQIKTKKKEEKDKELEKELKKRDAAKYFESWKSKKDEIIIKTHKEKKKEHMEKKKKEEEEKLDKTLSSKKSFDNWKAKKDDQLKKEHKEKKKKEKDQETEKEEEEYTKTIKNADEFQKWVESKGKPRKKPSPPTLTQRAWVPGSRHTGDCIPSKVQPVILPPSSNRARTMSGTFKTTKKYYDY